MARTKLKDRRANETSKVHFLGANGKAWDILITIGFDEYGAPKEVFSSSFKVGSDLNAIVSDACMVLSRLLQHDDDPADILAGMSEPYSLLGVIADALAKLPPSYPSEDQLPLPLPTRPHIPNAPAAVQMETAE